MAPAAGLLTFYVLHSTFDVDDSHVPMPGNASDPPWIWQPEVSGIEEQARKRLRWLHAATSLTDLGAIRGNRLEALKGRRAGQHSIRINDQWRIYFSWRDGNAHDVEIVDYH